MDSVPACIQPQGSVWLQALAYVGVIEVQWTKVSHYQCWSCFTCMHAAPGCLHRQAVCRQKSAEGACTYARTPLLHNLMAELAEMVTFWRGEVLAGRVW